MFHRSGISSPERIKKNINLNIGVSYNESAPSLQILITIIQNFMLRASNKITMLIPFTKQMGSGPIKKCQQWRLGHGLRGELKKIMYKKYKTIWNQFCLVNMIWNHNGKHWYVSFECQPPACRQYGIHSEHVWGRGVPVNWYPILNNF